MSLGLVYFRSPFTFITTSVFPVCDYNEASADEITTPCVYMCMCVRGGGGDFIS